MAAAFDELRLEYPIVQAGMGGGLSDHRLAAAVSDSGGLGTIGMLTPPRLDQELQRARQLTGKPVAVNLLLPFARDRHWRVAADADVVVTFWGTPVRRTARVWIHQCGSIAELQSAMAAGVDAAIIQGVEAGGHVRGDQSAAELLEQARTAARGLPLLLAGGIAQRDDVRRALDWGARGVVAGTRFLLTPESAAHEEYKRRLLGASRTILTDLFGLGWPAPHRVVVNRAVRRWAGDEGRTPYALRVLNRGFVPLASRLPLGLTTAGAARQPAWLPLLSPTAPLHGWPQQSVDTAPLYAGETVARIHNVRPAAELVGELVP